MDYIILNIFSGILILAISAIPAVLSTKTSGNVRMLLVVLAVFTIIHGTYHLADAVGIEFLSDSVLRPLSVGVLIMFGIIALKVTRKNAVKRGKMQN